MYKYFVYSKRLLTVVGCTLLYRCYEKLVIVSSVVGLANVCAFRWGFFVEFFFFFQNSTV